LILRFGRTPVCIRVQTVAGGRDIRHFLRHVCFTE
jgi:hypothetical protein